jgi:hypothetical protein
VRAKNLAEILDLLIHAVEHLPDRVDFDFALFEALDGEANRQVLRQLNKDRLIRLRVRCLRGQSRERLLQRVLGAARQL